MPKKTTNPRVAPDPVAKHEPTRRELGLSFAPRGVRLCSVEGCDWGAWGSEPTCRRHLVDPDAPTQETES